MAYSSPHFIVVQFKDKRYSKQTCRHQKWFLTFRRKDRETNQSKCLAVQWIGLQQTQCILQYLQPQHWILWTCHQVEYDFQNLWKHKGTNPFTRLVWATEELLYVRWQAPTTYVLWGCNITLSTTTAFLGWLHTCWKGKRSTQNQDWGPRIYKERLLLFTLTHPQTTDVRNVYRVNSMRQNLNTS